MTLKERLFSSIHIACKEGHVGLVKVTLIEIKTGNFTSKCFLLKVYWPNSLWWKTSVNKNKNKTKECSNFILYFLLENFDQYEL